MEKVILCVFAFSLVPLLNAFHPMGISFFDIWLPKSMISRYIWRNENKAEATLLDMIPEKGHNLAI